MTSERGESMEMYIVVVIYSENEIIFRFNELSDAMEFASTCIETGDNGTAVEIRKDDQDERP